MKRNNSGDLEQFRSSFFDIKMILKGTVIVFYIIECYRIWIVNTYLDNYFKVSVSKFDWG